MVLLEFSADKSLKDTNGETALDCAKKSSVRIQQRIPGSARANGRISPLSSAVAGCEHLKAKVLRNSSVVVVHSCCSSYTILGYINAEALGAINVFTRYSLFMFSSRSGINP